MNLSSCHEIRSTDFDSNTWPKGQDGLLNIILDLAELRDFPFTAPSTSGKSSVRFGHYKQCRWLGRHSEQEVTVS